MTAFSASNCRQTYRYERVVQVKSAVPRKWRTIQQKHCMQLPAWMSPCMVVQHSCTAQLYSQLHGPDLAITMHGCAAQLHSQLHGPDLAITMQGCAAQLYSQLPVLAWRLPSTAVLHSCTASCQSWPGDYQARLCCTAAQPAASPGLPITMHGCAAQLHSLLHYTIVKGWCLLTCSLQHKLDKVVGEAALDGLKQYIIIRTTCILQQTPERVRLLRPVEQRPSQEGHAASTAAACSLL
jgi:hypothetical protein